jgi:hypothetical protein
MRYSLLEKNSVQLPVCDQKVPRTHCNPTFLHTKETLNAQNSGIPEILFGVTALPKEPSLQC